MAGRFQAGKFRSRGTGNFHKSRGLGGGKYSGGLGKKLGPTITARKSKFKVNNPYWVRKLGQARVSALRLQGAYVRRRAMSSMKRVGKQGLPSPPGTPPRYRAKNYRRSLRYILFDYDPTIDGLWVGPIYFRRAYPNATVPKVHEHGPISVRRTITYVKSVDGKPRRAPSRQEAVTGEHNARYRRRSNSLSDKQRKAYQRMMEGGRVRKAKMYYRATYPRRNFMRRAVKKEIANGGMMRAFNTGWKNAWR